MSHLSLLQRIPSESCFRSIRFVITKRALFAKQWLALPLVFLLGYSSYAQVPVANFTANKTTGCGPLVVNFTDQSSNNPTAWNWDFGNGTLSQVQSPTIVYSVPGIYTVKLVVSNANGTHGITKTNYIVVDPSPIPGFSANFKLGCAPSTITFTDQSNPQGGTITNWAWDFGDGTTSTQQNPLKTYTTPGFYTVSLRVTSITGCTGFASVPNYIRIVSGVTAEFSNTDPVTCKPPFAVSFTNLTSAPGNVTFQWNLGNSATSTQANPSTTYAAPGTYNVSLTVRSDLGCTGTITKPVTISGPVPSITVPDTVCLNSVVTFQSGTTPVPLSAQWDFGNGVQSTLLNDTTSYSAPGNYVVKLINNFGTCTDSAFKTIHVNTKPVIDFTAPVAGGCKAPVTVNFQDLSPAAATWQWNFGDGGTSNVKNSPYNYATEGQFDVTLTIADNKGCTNTLTKPAFIKIVKPTIQVTNLPNGGCIPFSFTPTPSVTSIDGIASWFWDYGDGATSTAQNPPPHVYTDSGTYTLKLKITTTGGCSDSLVAVNAIKTGPLPHPAFTFNAIDTCASAVIQFTDQSYPADRWVWVFGDGTTSTDQNPMHQFADTGTFHVALTVYNNGCPLTYTNPQSVHIKPPISNFEYQVNCNNQLQVTFVDKSKVNPNYGPITYLWNFGDPANSTSNQPNPVFNYPALGSYNVSLTVTNGSCSTIFTQEVKLVGEPANFTISKTNVCRAEIFRVTAIDSDPDNVFSYAWSIAGGPFSLGSGRAFNFAFPDTGTYSIGLRITDINGCINTKVVPGAVTVTGPESKFTPAIGGCANTGIIFTDASTPAATLNKWTWDFGDGTQPQVFTSAPFTHSYADTGHYVVKLTVQDTKGCTHTFKSPDTVVITRPDAHFTSNYKTICPAVDVQFMDSTEGNITGYTWDFGDGNTGTGKNPTHSYAGKDSSYTVKLMVTDFTGCKDTATITNYISVRKPKPAFDIKDTTTICPPLETKFTFLGNDYESFLWDFGDGTTSTLFNPTHFYNAYGTYQAKLILTGYGGCTAADSSAVYVINPNTATILQYNPLTACNELMVDFNITTPPSTRFTFFYGDGKFDESQTKIFQHFYPSPAFYRPSIILKDSLQCQVAISGLNTIRVIGAIPLFGVDKKSFCDSGTVVFTNYTIGNDPVTSRTWNFGDNTTSPDLNPVHHFSQPGTYIVSQSVTTQTGCSKTIYDTIRVYGTPHPLINGDSIACINELFTFHGSLTVPDTAIVWGWKFGNGAVSPNQDITVTYTASGNYVVFLQATNIKGCTDTVSKKIYVPPMPTISFTNQPIIPVGTGATLPASYGPDIASYKWTPPNNLSCTDCPNPFANPKYTTKYKVEVTDIYGCTNSNEVTVTVVCNGQNYFLPNTFSPNGDGVNDVFAPRGTGVARISSLKIFNRWGEMVFERHNFMANDRTPTGGWDGTYKGKPASSDVYVYIVEFICDNAEIIPVKGNVTLIR